ncbi:MAG TPA: Fic family protein [Saprospiraceae bacterium]|nr:Fic family protein [Saprospiraceae bacterium]
MDNMKLEIIPTSLLSEYLEQVPKDLQTSFDALHEAAISTSAFSFYTSVASVFSSKIEGEDIELDSYIKYKAMGIEFKPDYTKKTDDLYNAYTFAKENALTPQNISKIHALLAVNFVEQNKLGKYRSHNMYVATPDGKIEYVAASPYEVEKEMTKLYKDIAVLLQQNLSIQEVFYYASFIHLVFVKIHPWNDGNGRSARLIEKWFIAQKLGEKAWFLQSEKMYYNQHSTYYKNIRLLGLEYPELDYSQALPFLLMLPKIAEL